VAITNSVSLMLFASMAFASARQNTGCGLGAEIWDSSKSDNSAVSQTIEKEGHVCVFFLVRRDRFPALFDSTVLVEL
jgi:hypothetical protein